MRIIKNYEFKKGVGIDLCKKSKETRQKILFCHWLLYLMVNPSRQITEQGQIEMLQKSTRFNPYFGRKTHNTLSQSRD